MLIALLVPALAQTSPATRPAPSASPVTATPAPPAATVPAGVYTAPAGWVVHPMTMPRGIVKIVQLWMPATAKPSPYEWINLGMEHLPKGMNLAMLGSDIQAQIEQVYEAANVVAFHTERICHGQQAGWYMERHPTFGAKTLETEQTFGFADGLLWVVTYVRPAGTLENPAARASLDTLCPVPGA